MYRHVHVVWASQNNHRDIFVSINLVYTEMYPIIGCIYHSVIMVDFLMPEAQQPNIDISNSPYILKDTVEL